ncbi:hypothetical protein [Mucilaginibacter sp. PAMB04168]|uniref:hypothetical protein n=1 Tax=Mucilaginibacter sp. PAMB04168 TaxID=3138567 RepID=UPI0031F6F28F
MTGFNQFANLLSPLTPIANNELQEKLKCKTFDKGDYLLNSGQVCRHVFFIDNGLQPAIEPTNINSISQQIKGTQIDNMHNYYYKVTGRYYFAGMYTAILPMVPGIYAIYRLTKNHKPIK